MAEQTVDLQLVLSGLRRRRRLVLTAALLGALLGTGFGLPLAADVRQLEPGPPADQSRRPGPTAEQVKTEIRIAKSDSVLAPAARASDPGCRSKPSRGTST